MNERELATVLAALRFWQGIYCDPGSDNRPDDDYPDHFCDIVPLSEEEIDALCDKLNVSSK
jgi:hypothetical protein